MNRWALFLADVPPSLQRLIARHHRISLPRRCSEAERLRRLRQALCRPAAVRATYFALPPDAQAALQHLRECPRGLSLAELTARYGPLRPYAQIAADRTPHSLSEQLLLLGFLLPRPPTPRHPTRFLLPPELRAALPRPLALPDLGAAPPAPSAPVLRAATALLLACAERVLPLRQDGSLRAESLRVLLPRLSPLGATEAEALCRFTLPLLRESGLLAPHGAAAALSPAGLRFLALPQTKQLQQLRAAWLGAPQLDAWLRRLLVSARGLDLPLFRRRLLAWAAALPVQRLLEPSRLYAALLAAFGPLSDAQTHGFRTVDRLPWQDKRAAAVWEAALHGPLSWLGIVAWAEAGASERGRYCYATALAQAALACWQDTSEPATQVSRAPAPWRYGAVGLVLVPHQAEDAAVVKLLCYARWETADAESSSYRISARSLAAATRDGHSLSALRALLERRAGPLNEEWRALLASEAPCVRVLHSAVVLGDEPALLERASRQRSVRRYLSTRLAPGIALAEPERAAALVRALERLDLAVEVRGEPSVAPPEVALSDAERALLLSACAAYRAHPPDGGARLPALAALEARLRVGLSEKLLSGVSAPSPTATAATDAGVRDDRRWTMDDIGLEPDSAAGSVEANETGLTSADTSGLSVAGGLLPHRQEGRKLAAEQSAQPLVAWYLGGETGTGTARLTSAAALVGLVSALWSVLLGLLVRRAVGLWGAWHVARVARAGVASSGPAAKSAEADQASELGGAPAAHAPGAVAIATSVSLLRQAISHRRLVRMDYTAAHEDAPSVRVVRPLRLENHGELWYLQAYCTRSRAERLLRLERISALALLDAHARIGPPLKPGPRRAKAVSAAPGTVRTRRVVAVPREGFFPAPPAPPPNSPLVRVWLVE